MGKKEGVLHKEMGRDSLRYGGRACLCRGEGGEGKILKREREKYEWRDESRGGRERSRRAGKRAE